MEGKAVPLLPPGNILVGAFSSGGEGGQASSPGPRHLGLLAFTSEVTSPILASGASLRLESLGHEAWFGHASESQSAVFMVGKPRFM